MTSLETGTDNLLARTEGRVAVLTFNRPEARNALTPSMYDGFAAVLPAIAADPRDRCGAADRGRRRVLRRG